MNKIASLLLVSLLGTSQDPKTLDFAALEKQPLNLKGAQIAGGKATLSNDRWGYLVTPDEHADVEIETTFTIQDAAKQFGFFGASWSVWPDLTYSDQGFEVSILARSDKESGYRIQLS